MRWLKYKYFLIALALVTVVFIVSKPLARHASIDATIYTQRGELMFHLETATTPAERKRGLMSRDTIGNEDGMIFVFPEAGSHQFWMKNTRIPLDMIFIDAAQTIVAIVPNVPPHTLESRGPTSPTLAVIELDGGRAAADGIALGDKVRYELPKEITVQ